jgi:hypothetical protein
MLLLGARGRRPLGGSPTPRPVDQVLDLERPEVIAGWAGLAALMIIPATVLILVFPSFLVWRLAMGARVRLASGPGGKHPDVVPDGLPICASS